MDMAKVRTSCFCFGRSLLWNDGLDPSVPELEYFPYWSRIWHRGRKLLSTFSTTAKRTYKNEPMIRMNASLCLGCTQSCITCMMYICAIRVQMVPAPDRFGFSYITRFTQETFLLCHETLSDFNRAAQQLVCNIMKLRPQKRWVPVKEEGREQSRDWETACELG